MTAPVYVLDELRLRPGQTEAFLDAFEGEYRPGAEARGMELLHTWVTPPEGPPDQGESVLLVWRLDGVAGFWRMRSQNAAPEVLDWWRRCEEFVVERSRRYAVEPAARDAFSAAGRVHG